MGPEAEVVGGPEAKGRLRFCSPFGLATVAVGIRLSDGRANGTVAAPPVLTLAGLAAIVREATGAAFRKVALPSTVAWLTGGPWDNDVTTALAPLVPATETEGAHQPLGLVEVHLDGRCTIGATQASRTMCVKQAAHVRCELRVGEVAAVHVETDVDRQAEIVDGRYFVVSAKDAFLDGRNPSEPPGMLNHLKRNPHGHGGRRAGEWSTGVGGRKRVRLSRTKGSYGYDYDMIC